jgi:hypothetical protein
MSIKKPLKNKKQLYNQAFFLANAFLIFSIIMFSIYFAAPILGGKPSISALIHCGSWILLALGMRIMSQRARRGLRIRAYEYLLGCLVAIINFVVWFSYPINIILSILSVVGMAISYRAQNKRLKEE